jgi:hypothetical protein
MSDETVRRGALLRVPTIERTRRSLDEELLACVPGWPAAWKRRSGLDRGPVAGDPAPEHRIQLLGAHGL